jgi:hypothetical protein
MAELLDAHLKLKSANRNARKWQSVNKNKRFRMQIQPCTQHTRFLGAEFPYILLCAPKLKAPGTQNQISGDDKSGHKGKQWVDKPAVSEKMLF